jgi:putative membrane protein
MATIKLLHILFLFMWVGSLLTLTRLLGYLPKEEPTVQSRFVRIFRRLYLFIDLPSMILALATGVVLLVIKGVDMKQGWFHMKLTFALLLVIADIYTGVQICKLKDKFVTGRGIKYKILHGLTALFLIFILIAVYILKVKG